LFITYEESNPAAIGFPILSESQTRRRSDFRLSRKGKPGGDVPSDGGVAVFTILLIILDKHETTWYSYLRTGAGAVRLLRQTAAV
jgi:hypothetical protein